MSSNEEPDPLATASPPATTAARAASAFTEYRQELQDYLARRLSRAEDVRDLVQEIFLRFLRIEQNRLVENPQAFLYGIASNVVLECHRLRQRQRVVFNSRAVDHGAEHPHHIRQDELTESLVLEEQLKEAANQLTPTQLRILTLWRRDGLSFEQIAKLLSLSPHTVKKYAVQAVASIRVSCQ